MTWGNLYIRPSSRAGQRRKCSCLGQLGHCRKRGPSPGAYRGPGYREADRLPPTSMHRQSTEKWSLQAHGRGLEVGARRAEQKPLEDGGCLEGGGVPDAESSGFPGFLAGLIPGAPGTKLCTRSFGISVAGLDVMLRLKFLATMGEHQPALC